MSDIVNIGSLINFEKVEEVMDITKKFATAEVHNKVMNYIVEIPKDKFDKLKVELEKKYQLSKTVEAMFVHFGFPIVQYLLLEKK